MDCSLELDPSKVCRVCLEPQESPQSIFTKHIIEGNIRTLPEIILSCFQVDITSNPNLPKLICESCKSSIIQFFKFKENVVRTEKLLSDLFKTDDEIVLKQEHFDVDEEQSSDANPEEITLLEDDTSPENKVENEVDGENGLEAEENEYEDQYVEEIQLDTVYGEPEFKIINIDDSQPKSQNCEEEVEEIYELSNISSIKQDGNAEDENELSNLEFIVDTSTTYGEFNDEGYLEEPDHSDADEQVIMVNQKEVGENSYEEEPAPKKRRYRKANKDGDAKSALTLMCKVCNKRIQSDDDNHDQLHEYYSHIVSAEAILQCFQCSQVFICPDELRTHLQQIHNDINDEEELITDLQLLDEDTKQAFWVCGSCNTDFVNINDLKMHMVTHMTKLGCPVLECGFEYSNFHYFYQHMKRNHLTMKLLTCKYCGKADIPDFRSLQNHYRLECSAKMYKCEFCNRTFFTDKSYKTHVEIRHIEKKFICELCGKSFAQITELKIHTRMHTGERPFECTICKKSYKTASGRAAHMDSHSNNVFPCDICGKQMNSRRNLVTHVRRHTEEKRLKCEVCGKKFYTKYHLNLHASKLHNKS